MCFPLWFASFFAGKIEGPEVQEDDWGPPIEDDAEKELQNVLHKARKLKQKKERKAKSVAEQVRLKFKIIIDSGKSEIYD